jgi:protein O-mannosyl-transferase
VRSYPTRWRYAEVHNNLGSALARLGRLDEALASFQKAVRLQPDDAEAHSNLGNLLTERGRYDEALAHYHTALNSNRDDAETLNNLAWLLATCPQPSLRNGAEAIEVAQRAKRLAGGQRADLLDTLAAAYAEAGRFSEALKAARQALDLARQQNQQELVDGLRARIALYEVGQPFHQPPR